MELREYQLQLVHDLRLAIAQGYKRICVYLPTGGGKTVVASRIVQLAVEKGSRVNFHLHRDSLCVQTSKKFKQFGIPHGVIKSEWPEDISQPVQICGAQTLGARNLPVPPANIDLIDEAHSVSFYESLLGLFQDPERCIIGFTATPFSKGKRQLASLYQILVKGPEPNELIRLGFLTPGRYFAYEDVDLAEVGISRRGDFLADDLQRALNYKELNARLVSEYSRIAYGRPGFVFSTGVEHSKAIQQEFLAADIPCAHIDGKTSRKQREKYFKEQESGELLIISSIETLTEGVDQPCVSWLGIVRPTLSHALHVQMLGRAARPCPEQHKADFIVSDLGTGNLQRFGRLEDQIDVTLDAKKRKSLEGDAPTKICPHCTALILAWRLKCPECGESLAGEISQVPESFLQEYLSEEEIEQRKHYRNLCYSAYQRGYKPGWAVLEFKDRFGFLPASWWSFGAIFQADNERSRRTYRHYLQRLADRHGHGKDWVERYMLVEFGTGYEVAVTAEEMSRSTDIG